MHHCFRFCGVSNSTVKRNDGGIHAIPTLEVKDAGVQVQVKNTAVQQTSTLVHTQPKMIQQSSTISSGMRSLGSAKVVKTDNNSTSAYEQNSKSAENKRNIPQLPVKKGPHDKNFSVTGSKLPNMWVCTSAKPKGECAASKANDSLPNSSGLLLFFH